MSDHEGSFYWFHPEKLSISPAEYRIIQDPIYTVEPVVDNPNIVKPPEAK